MKAGAKAFSIFFLGLTYMPGINQLPTHTDQIVSVFQHEKMFIRSGAKPGLGKGTGVYHFADGNIVVRLVKLPVYRTACTVVAGLTVYSGGDGQTHAGSVFIIPTEKKLNMLRALEKGLKLLPSLKSRNGRTYAGFVQTPAYSPLLELMRFSLPYGSSLHQAAYAQSKVTDSVSWKQDLTGLEAALEKEVYIGVYIDGPVHEGQSLSLNLHYYPETGGAEKPRAWIVPIFNTMSLFSGQEPGTVFNGDSLHVKFIVPAGLQDLQLRYISTGLGIPKGEAYRQRLNQVLWDDDEIARFIPWRTDCGSFQAINQDASLSSNGMSESDLSRAGWCPGSLTDAFVINLEEPEAGEHEVKVIIPVDSLASSTSYWTVSGVLTGHFGTVHSRFHLRRHKGVNKD